MSRIHNASSPLSTQYDDPSSSASTHFTRPTLPLRVYTDTLVPLNSRLRSNSTQSNSMSPPIYPSHQFSRSFSHNQVLPSVRDDVALAVSGLRGLDTPATGQGEGYEDESAIYAESPDDVEPEVEEQTVRRIREALEQSPDRGDTLDLSRRGIESIGPQAVEVFRKGVGKDQKGVWRLALSYNSLTDNSITWTFSKLSRLRYLNLKGNNFTEFPEALSEMMALEILDLSKNKITRFPSTPGRLKQLKVLSLTSNRIRLLPSYLTDFNHLKVFKVDLNPIEWPPRDVLGSLIDNDAAKQSPTQPTPNGRPKKDEDLRPWIDNMKKWMRATQDDGESEMSPDPGRREEDAYLASEEEPNSALSADGLSGSMIHFGSSSSPSLATLSSQQTIRPARDASSDRLNGSPEINQHRRRDVPYPHQSSGSMASPPPQAPPASLHFRDDSNASLVIPPLSASSASSSAHSRTLPSNVPPPPLVSPPTSGHSRGASYTATQRLSGILRAKKSLPDLRKSHARIMEERRNDGKEGESTRPLGMGIERSRSNIMSSKAWDASPPVPSRPNRNTLTRKGSADMLFRLKSPHTSEINNGQADSGEPAAAEESRNSYFRRLSTLPASSVSKTIPKALLRFIDATRGILYALSQVHVSLRQFLMYAVDDKVGNVFSRVMQPANKHLDALVNALDRFESISRRNKLPVQAVKDVVTVTKACMVVTGKAVAVLKLQLPALQISDLRYTRTLLLMIYGSMTEIACSWNDMTPLLAQIRQGLNDKSTLVKRPASHRMVPSLSGHGRPPISPIAESAESNSPAVAAPVSSPSPRAATDQRGQAVHVPGKRSLEIARQRDRRLAGSFSHEDVERGMLMPSPGGPRNDASLRNFRMPGQHRPHNSSFSAVDDQTEVSEEEPEEEILAPAAPSRPIQRDTSVDASSSVPLTPPDGLEMNGNQPRIQGQRGHKPSSSSDSTSSGLNVPRKPSVDVRPPTSVLAALFDDDLLDLLDNATDSAYTVWLKLAEDIGASSPELTRTHGRMDSQDSAASSLHRRHPSSMSNSQYEELATLLPQAEQTTSALKESLMAVRADPANWTTISLPDQAQAFIRTVVSVAERVKSISTTHSFPIDVRQSLSKLTQTTRECAILIQVSSINARDLSGPHRPAPGRPPLSARSISPFRTKEYPRYGASNEDLSLPSATFNSNWAGPPSAGLRGLQLPSRQAAMSRSRSANNQGSGDSMRAPRMMGSASSGVR